MEKRTLLLFLSSIAFSFVFGEVFVRMFAPPRNVGPAFSEYDSTYGKNHKKDFTCTRISPEFTFRFTTNSLGFRGPEPNKFPERGILFMGDSFTEGYGVTDGEEFPDLIRKSLEERFGPDEVPVVNAGIGDCGTGRSLKFLRNEGTRLNPRLIILQLTENDFFDDAYEGMFSVDSTNNLIPHATVDRPSARAMQKLIETIPGLSYSYLIGLIRQSTWWSVRNLGQAPEAKVLPQGVDQLEFHSKYSDNLTHRIVDEILALSEREHWPVIIFYVVGKGGRSIGLEKIAEKHKVPFLVAPMQLEHPEWFYKVDRHWNPAGHRELARRLMPLIDSSGALPR
jgi:lysophospholipase L1-like esterase